MRDLRPYKKLPELDSIWLHRTHPWRCERYGNLKPRAFFNIERRGQLVIAYSMKPRNNKVTGFRSTWRTFARRRCR